MTDRADAVCRSACVNLSPETHDKLRRGVGAERLEAGRFN